ncbi:MAG: family 16 glycoside hydrolase, partial [Chloroflexota bacterium]
TATVDFDNLTVLSLEGTEQPQTESNILFEDYFDSDASGWATGEFEDDYTVDEITIEDGVYTLNVTAKKQAYVEKTVPNRKFSDFVVTLDATPQDSEEHYSYGLAFRENTDYYTYAFEIGNDGLYSIQLYDGEWKTLKAWSSTDAIKVGETNELKVIADGSSLTFFVNDEELTSLEDDTLAEGTVGLIIDMFEEGKSTAVQFDNLVIRELNGVY